MEPGATLVIPGASKQLFCNKICINKLKFKVVLHVLYFVLGHYGKLEGHFLVSCFSKRNLCSQLFVCMCVCVCVCVCDDAFVHDNSTRECWTFIRLCIQMSHSERKKPIVFGACKCHQRSVMVNKPKILNMQ